MSHLNELEFTFALLPKISQLQNRQIDLFPWLTCPYSAVQLRNRLVASSISATLARRQHNITPSDAELDVFGQNAHHIDR